MARARISLWWVAPVVALAAAVGVAGGVLVERHGAKAPARRSSVSTAVARRTSQATAATSPASASPAHKTTSASKAIPLRLVSVSPAAKTTNVGALAPVVVRFSADLATGTPTPALSPSTAGTWSVQGATMTFTPSVPFPPLATVTLTVPAGASGPRSSAGGNLAHGATSSFRIQDGSILRLDQLLALLDYSPLAWVPTGPAAAPGDTAAQLADLYHAPAGTFTWRQRTWPAQLLSLWQPGRYDVMTRGLIMSFQADHGLDPNGALGPGLWHDLLAALAQHVLNTGGYNFALADKAIPESLTIWHDGAVVLHAPANTGIAVDPTQDGVYPVDTRLRNQVMRGTNPNGSHYADPVQFVAYFHGSQAVHYIPRADYGVPQSLGCIELSLADAATAWPYLAYGTLVDVIS